MNKEDYEILKENFDTLNRKYKKLSRGYRAVILNELLAECKLIPLKVAKSGLYEADLRRILGVEDE